MKIRKIERPFIAHCISCAKTENICLIPHRANGNMVGWIFACAACAPALYDATLKVVVEQAAAQHGVQPTADHASASDSTDIENVAGRGG